MFYSCWFLNLFCIRCPHITLCTPTSTLFLIYLPRYCNIPSLLFNFLYYRTTFTAFTQLMSLFVFAGLCWASKLTLTRRRAKQSRSRLTGANKCFLTDSFSNKYEHWQSLPHPEPCRFVDGFLFLWNKLNGRIFQARVVLCWLWSSARKIVVQAKNEQPCVFSKKSQTYVFILNIASSGIQTRQLVCVIFWSFSFVQQQRRVSDTFYNNDPCAKTIWNKHALKRHCWTNPCDIGRSSKTIKVFASVVKRFYQTTTQ